VQKSYAIKEGTKMLCNKCSFRRKFRRGILLHNIPSNDNKNARKNKIQIENSFTTNLREEKNFESCLLPVYFFFGGSPYAISIFTT
jgi:hypothetical protein